MAFDNSCAWDLQGLYVSWKPAGSPAPRLLRFNRALADELGLDSDEMASAAGLALLAGNAVATLAAAVEHDDLAPFERLLRVLEQPFDERGQDSAFALPAPAEQTACYRTFCGT